MANFDYTRYYNRWHPDTPEHVVQMRRHSWRRLQPWIVGLQSPAILDVGCGKGYLVGALLEHGFTNVLGIDIDYGQVQAAQKDGMPVEQVLDTVSWLQLRPKTYELICCFDVIEHIPLAQQVEFVAALYAALTDSGRLLCSVPNANSNFAARYRYGDYTHSSAFTENSLDFLLFHAGFREICISEDEIRPRLPWIPRPKLGWWYLRQLFRFFRRLQLISEIGYKHGCGAPLSLNLFAVARK